ncbi:hypothetical protein AJ88_23920 [Mesorhizobium amorphae CCBAU 01583]|nr:hypothetical protein AJ88_23920 [Mesorhizobium amorphae CCBAU 01583]
MGCRGDRDVTLDGDRVMVVEGHGENRAEALVRDQLFGRAAVLQAFAEAIVSKSRPWFFPDGSDNIKTLF